MTLSDLGMVAETSNTFGHVFSLWNHTILQIATYLPLICFAIAFKRRQTLFQAAFDTTIGSSPRRASNNDEEYNP